MSDELNSVTKLDLLCAKLDDLLERLNRLDERFIQLNEQCEINRKLILGLWVTVGAGVILQFFLK